jgi:hypothetical protein
VVVKFNRATKLNIQAIFRGGLLCSHSFGGKSYYIAILPWGGGGSHYIAIFYGGKSYYIVYSHFSVAMGEKWLYNAPIVVFPTSHFYGGKTDYGGKMAL